jgi:stearoyl-CoA desaturase (delta-9 desaturase)
MSNPAVEPVRSINWPASLVFVITGAIALVVAPWYGITHGYSLATVLCALFLVAANGMSITAGYHRLWSHRAYEAHWLVRLPLLVFGTMAIQNSVLIWSANHRVHHRFCDNNDIDPYSAGRGFWYSHIGWMLRNYPSATPDFSLVKDLERDPMLRFQHRYYLPLVLLTNFGIPVALGLYFGDFWGMLLLAGVTRLVISHHVTFFINSLAHMWGTQPYNDRNSAKDNPVLAFLTYGEGYHNFHHHFLHDYRNAIRWWQWDPTKWFIWALSKLRLTHSLRRTPAVTIQRAVVEMQLRRLGAGAAASADVDISESLARLAAPLRARVQQEVEAFRATLAEWSKVMDLRQQDLAHFRERSKEIVAALREQRRRLAELVAAAPVAAAA